MNPPEQTQKSWGNLTSLPIIEASRKDINWLWDRTIFLTKHGSHAYGTSTPTSDLDMRGFCIPPKPYFLGAHKRFEQAEFKGDPDVTVFGVQKFFKLAIDNNPNILEILFTDPQDHLIVTPAGRKILDSRHKFVAKKAKFTFSGYAVSQLKKIKSHYKWISNPPKAPPNRMDFGLPERTVIPSDQLQAAQSMIRKQIEQWNVPIDELDDAARIAVQERFVEALALIETGYRAQIVAELKGRLEEVTQDLPDEPVEYGLEEAVVVVQHMPGANLERIAGNLLGFSDNFLELLDKERQYKAKMDEWRSYQTWLATRNPKRSELEKKWGYDTKHAMHLVRLMRMCREILEGKGVIVRRPDADELMEIRNGLWKYEELLEWASKQEKELEPIYKASTLPHSAPVVELDDLLVSVVESSI